MTLSKIAIMRPVTTTMFFIGIVLLGAVSYRQLPVQLVPDVAFPGAMMFMRYEGLSVDDMVEKVTKPLEALAASTPRVREIQSWTSSGFSRVVVQFEFGTNMRFATLDLQEKMNQFRRTLPRRGVYARVFSFSTERMQTFLMEIDIRGKDDRETLRQIAEDILQPQLDAIDGVAEVRTGGYYNENIDIVFDRDKLIAHGLSLNRAISRIAAAAAGDVTLGRVRGPHENYSVTLAETVSNEDDLRRLPLDDKGIVRLADVADVQMRQHRSDWVWRVDGQNSVGLHVRKEAEANTLRVAAKVRKTLEELQDQLPPGYSATIDEDAAEIIEKIIRQVGWLAVIGGLLAMLVLVLFVRNLRMALIVCTAIPISVVTTFNLMYFGGLSLNVVTLVGLALGIGMLVDSAIVVLENIFRNFEISGHAFEASSRGTGEVWRALMATTLTNVVVFTPVLFAEGELRLIFREGALAIVFPITVSLLVALTLVPMVTSRVLAGRERRGGKRRWWRAIIERARNLLRRYHPYWPAHQRRPRRLYRELYLLVLRASLRHRVRLVMLVAALLIITVKICPPLINKGTMRRGTEGTSFPIYVQVPRGTSQPQLLRVLDVVEERLRKLPELEKTRSMGEVDEGVTVYAKLVPADKRRRSLRDVREEILDFIGEVPGATLSLYPFRNEGSEPTELRVAYEEGGMIEVHGAHWEALEWVMEGLARQLELIPGVARVEVAGMRGASEIQFTIDRQRAALYNIQAGDIAAYFQTSQRGGQLSQLTMERGTRKLDVRLRMGKPGHPPQAEDEEVPMSLTEVKTMEVSSPLGGTVPLAEVGYFRKVLGERYLSRRNMQFSQQLAYFLEPRANRNTIQQAIRALLKEIRLPAGYTAEITGEDKRVDENIRQVRWMLGITVVLVYMVMASVFESLLSPFVILFSFLLALIGVLWGMALSGSPFEELAMLGVIVLSGIVVNNGIVMMDFISQLRRERRYRRTAAILTSCRARLRPILMTTLTTVLGLLPMAIRSGEEFQWSGLAIIIICGLSVSTLLTLVVIPVMLIILEDAITLIRRLAARTWRWRWLLYFFWPPRMWTKRLELVPAGPPTVFSPTFATVMGRVAVTPEQSELRASGGEPAPRWSAAPTAARERTTGIEIRNVHMIYPLFRPRKLLHVIPSTRYKYGCRPPEGIRALRDVNLTIEKGIFGLVGPNGAGKTTLLQIVTGLRRPTYGSVTVNQLDVTAEGRTVRAEIGYLPQSYGLYGNSTAREYLAYYSLLLGIEGKARRRANIEAVLDQVGLRDVADEAIRTYSGGMRQRLGIARLLLTVPRVILVDEPTAGLDPIERVKFRILLSQLAPDRTVVFSTHIIDDISSSCKGLAVLNEGQVVYEGTPAGLIQSARGQIWEYVGKFEDEATIVQRFRLLYKKAAGPDRVLFRLIAADCDLPGARRVDPTLEDAYMVATTGRMKDEG